MKQHGACSVFYAVPHAMNKPFEGKWGQYMSLQIKRAIYDMVGISKSEWEGNQKYNPISIL